MRKDGHAEARYISGDHESQVGGSADVCGMCVCRASTSRPSSRRSWQARPPSPPPLKADPHDAPLIYSRQQASEEPAAEGLWGIQAV